MEKVDWYQDNDTLNIIIYKSNIRPDSIKLILIDKNLEIHYKISTDEKSYKLKLNLLSHIFDPNLDDDDNYKVMSTEKKIELKLKKKTPGLWSSLQDGVGESQCVMHQDKFNKEYFEGELKELDDGDDDKFVKLLQDIYANGNESIKRSLYKSFTESSGQVLSTNWDSDVM